MEMKGTVKWFDNKNGYGFITEEDGNELFVHYSDIATEGFRKLEEGQEVTYERAECDKGNKAINVIPA